VSAQPGLCGVVLAAGEGRRFDPSGRSWKLLARMADGRTVLAASCEALVGQVDEIVVVVSDREAEARAALAGMPVRFVSCDHAIAGPGASIKCGVRSSDPATGWLIALADMPWSRPSTIAGVAAALTRGALIARPVHRGMAGHPVGFSRSMRAALLAIDDSRGAATLCEPDGGMIRIEVDDPGCVADVDLPADLGESGRVSSTR
jgi:molybdenum cofactor cytidylyltransferase